MPERIALVASILILYVAFRQGIYHYIIPNVMKFGNEKQDKFDWWWSWGLAFPLTMLTVWIVSGTYMFIFQTGLFSRY